MPPLIFAQKLEAFYALPKQIKANAKGEISGKFSSPVVYQTYRKLLYYFVKDNEAEVPEENQNSGRDL